MGSSVRGVCAFLAVGALALPTWSQSFDHEWARFQPSPGSLGAGGLSSSSIEVDFASGDLDQDGRIDLVVARKEPFTESGGRTNVLLMNENGVLTDRTASYATLADVPGDNGFAELTTDRDVTLADVDLDGWLDVVTATALMDGQPKHLSHARVYMNQRESGGAWQGLRYEESRIPQLYTVGGGAQAMHAVEVLAGDVTDDGFPELYLVDHDSGFAGYFEPSFQDLEDRLLVNDGNGYFDDETTLRLTSTMYTGAFGLGGSIGDFNQDQANDILRGSTGSIDDNYQELSLTYNDPANEGVFNIYQELYDLSPYMVASDDLNNDGRLDVVAGDDGSDRYLINTGVDVLGRVIWSPALLFDFLTGGDDGFVGQITIADLDGDGWKDVLVADEDIDVPQGSFDHRRLHVYHNLGGAAGSEVVLREERESSSSAPGNWIGVVGLESAEMENTYDVAAFDVDGDGWTDLVVGGGAGTMVLLNETGAVTCQEDLGFQGPGIARLSVCGDELLPGGEVDVVLSNAAPNATAFLGYGLFSQPTPYAGGTVVPLPLLGTWTVVTDGAGKSVAHHVVTGLEPPVLYVQAVVVDPTQPGGVGISNALRLTFP